MEPIESNKLDFDNTEIAFSYKTDKQMRKISWLFRVMNNNLLVNLGSKITPLVLKLNLPFVKPAIRSTIFEQFVGGESLMDTQKVIDLLYRHNTMTILDYGAEAKNTEEELDEVVKELTKGIEFAASNDSVPVVIVKISGIADNGLLEKIQGEAVLTPSEKIAKEKLYIRLDSLCSKAHDLGVSVMIDAEESWVQESIDNLTNEMMSIYNKEKVVVYNTYQLYRHDKLAYLKSSYKNSQKEGYMLGAKIVRGAYMNKEKAYADANNIPTVINPSKKKTDEDYDAAIKFCIDNYETIASVCATHNRNSSLLQASLIEERGISKKHPHLNFSQLYGMSDNITFNLSQAGYNVAKYLPYGPIKEVIPYLIRRAQENTAVTGDMSRELSFIKDEVRRRGVR